MTNEMKLLRAFIEAMGYEVETTKDVKITYHPDNILANGEPKENALRESTIVTYDYKVTKKPEFIGNHMGADIFYTYNCDGSFTEISPEEMSNEKDT